MGVRQGKAKIVENPEKKKEVQVQCNDELTVLDVIGSFKTFVASLVGKVAALANNIISTKREKE